MLMWRWLNDVPLEDPVERRLAPLLQVILLGLIVALGVALIERLLSVGVEGLPPGSLFSIIFFVGAMLFTMWLVRSGRFKTASLILVLTLHLLALRRLLEATAETSTQATLTFFLTLTIAGLFLGRWAVISVVLSAAAAAIFTVNNQMMDSYAALVFIIVLILVGFLISQLGSTLRHELALARTRNTELERARLELERHSNEISAANERLITTLKSIGDAVITTDADGRVTLMNGVAQRLTGWTQDDAEGQTLPSVFSIINEYTRATVESPVDKVIRTGTIVGLANHTLLLSKDGREIPIDDSGAPIRDRSGKIVGVVLVFRDITERKAAEHQALELATINERHRLARELHDAVSQVLFSANIIAESLPRLKESNPERAFEQLEQLHRLTQGAAAEMRTLLYELRPENLANSKLEDLLSQLCRAIQARKRIEATMRIRSDERKPLPEEVHLALYRIAQESFTNIAKHANARDVRVRYNRRPNGVEMVIVDNGGGFDINSPLSGFGLASMRERAEAIKAKLHVQSRIGTGTRVRLVWDEQSE